LPELEVQYADYAAWQRNWLQGAVLRSQLGYWEKQLRGAAMLELLADKSRPAIPTYRGGRHSFVLDAAVSEGIKQLARREGTTLFMTLLAAFQVLLSRYSGQTDIVTGTVVAGRNRQETEPLIGLFINTLALRTNLAGDPSFSELLRRVREVCLGAYAHQDVPFDKLVEELQPDRKSGRSPLFQVTFGLQNAPLGSLELPELELEILNLENDHSRFDLTVWLMERGGRLMGEMTYNKDVLEEPTIKTMRRRYETLLASVVRDPQTRLSMLEFIPEEEKEQLLIKEQQSVDLNAGMLKTVKRVPLRDAAGTS
jgi:non-ribosomal peptide synthetase component F